MANRFKNVKLVTEVYSQVVTSKGKVIPVSLVTMNASWRRTLFANEQAKEDFVEGVKLIKDSFKGETVEIATKEPEHTSLLDPRPHFLAVGLDKEGIVIESRHVLKPKGGGGSGDEASSGDERSNKSKSPGKGKSPGKTKSPNAKSPNAKSPKTKSPGQVESDGEGKSSDEERFDRQARPFDPFN